MDLEQDANIGPSFSFEGNLNLPRTRPLALEPPQYGSLGIDEEARPQRVRGNDFPFPSGDNDLGRGSQVDLTGPDFDTRPLKRKSRRESPNLLTLSQVRTPDKIPDDIKDGFRDVAELIIDGARYLGVNGVFTHPALRRDIEAAVTTFGGPKALRSYAEIYGQQPNSMGYRDLVKVYNAIASAQDMRQAGGRNKGRPGLPLDFVEYERPLPYDKKRYAISQDSSGAYEVEDKKSKKAGKK